MNFLGALRFGGPPYEISLTGILSPALLLQERGRKKAARP